jgi:hypothetical protein
MLMRLEISWNELERKWMEMVSAFAFLTSKWIYLSKLCLVVMFPKLEQNYPRIRKLLGNWALKQCRRSKFRYSHKQDEIPVTRDIARRLNQWKKKQEIKSVFPPKTRNFYLVVDSLSYL